jgi:two-component system, chemotaxis family, chemotaxis protein CheY
MLALVVDDSRATRSMLRTMLSRLGFDVVEAGHGVEALEKLGAIDGVDFALVDWNMPEMDGLSFVRAVRSDPSYERLPLVMVTTESEPAQVVRALSAGADEYAMKPFTADIILDKLALLGLDVPDGR